MGNESGEWIILGMKWDGSMSRFSTSVFGEKGEQWYNSIVVDFRFKKKWRGTSADICRCRCMSGSRYYRDNSREI